MTLQHHVYPPNDLREHNTDTADCWCDPYIESGVNPKGVIYDIVVHNALDERERYETGREEFILTAKYDPINTAIETHWAAWWDSNAIPTQYENTPQTPPNASRRASSAERFLRWRWPDYD